jgi:H+/Cl- antiporter ClcA
VQISASVLAAVGRVARRWAPQIELRAFVTAGAAAGVAAASVSAPDLSVIYQSVLIGAVGGGLGGLFARALAYPRLTRLPKHWALRAFVCGLVCAGLCLLTGGVTAGSGYEPAERMLMGVSAASADPLFPFNK